MFKQQRQVTQRSNRPPKEQQHLGSAPSTGEGAACFGGRSMAGNDGATAAAKDWQPSEDEVQPPEVEGQPPQQERRQPEDRKLSA